MAGVDRSEAAPGRRVAVLVRHGHFARPDQMPSAHSLLPLTDRGRDQARAAADAILALGETHALEIDARIECSHLLRAWQTATLIGEVLAERLDRAFAIEPHDQLAERGLGAAANLRFDEIRAMVAADPRLAPPPEGWRRMPEYRLPVPGAESLMQAGARTATRIATSLESIPDADPRDLMRLIVAHGGCLRHAAVQLGVVDVRIVPPS